MRSSRIILAALAAISLFSISPADARQGSSRNLNVPIFDAAAVPAYPFPGQIMTPGTHSRAASRSSKALRTANHGARRREASVRAPEGQTALADRTLAGYANHPGKVPTAEQRARLGLVTVPTASGIEITVSSSFSAPIVAFIAENEASGRHFTRIKCWAPGGHVYRSLHLTGDACDFRPFPLQKLARGHGLRPGTSFTINGHPDYEHVDNAYAFGLPYVRTAARVHKTRIARQ